MTEKLTEQDLTSLLTSKNRYLEAVRTAEKATAEARIAQLEHQSFIQLLFIRYGLKINDSINDITGIITPDGAIAKETE